jgi:hypothetical protein
LVLGVRVDVDSVVSGDVRSGKNSAEDETGPKSSGHGERQISVATGLEVGAM